MINHREKLLEDFKAFKEEYNSVQTELNELFHVELDNKTLSVVKEDHEQLLKDLFLIIKILFYMLIVDLIKRCLVL